MMDYGTGVYQSAIHVENKRGRFHVAYHRSGKTTLSIPAEAINFEHPGHGEPVM